VAQRSVRVEQKSGDLAWMQSVAGELMTLSANQPATVAPSGESLVVLIDRTAHECGLGSSLTGQTPDGETAIRVRLEGADFDKMLACLATLQQVHAVTIQSATFDRAGKPGLINASLILNRAGG
jgi:type II secretory pathway component PulM